MLNRSRHSFYLTEADTAAAQYKHIHCNSNDVSVKLAFASNHFLSFHFLRVAVLLLAVVDVYTEIINYGAV